MQPETRKAAAKEEWQRHWKLVVAATMGAGVAGVLLYSNGLMIQPIAAETGWSRTEITSGMLILAVIGTLFSPAIGLAVDHFGSRAIAVPGTILFCIALGCLGLAGHQLWTWWLLWGLLGMAGVLLKPTVWSRAISSRFDHGRGFALSITLSGAGIAAAVVPLLANGLIEAYGWRGAYAGLAAITAVIVTPFMWLFFYDGSERTSISASERSMLPGWTFARGIRSRQLYQLAAVGFLGGVVISGFTVHFVSLAVERGFSRGEAAGLMTLVAILSLMGRLVTGALLDRANAAMITCVGISLPAFASTTLLLAPESAFSIVAAAILIGLSTGSEAAAVAYLATRYFGLRKFGVLFGVITSCLIASTGAGPFVGSYIRDLTGHYDLFLIMTVPVSLVCVLLLANLGAYPDHKQPAVTAE